jgi:hypothetical protein
MYRGSKPNLRQKNYEKNMLIKRIEEHVNEMIAKKED